MPWLSFLLFGYAALSVATFGAMTLDKFLARSGSRRVPEATLHAMEFLGGWPGSLAAMVLVRHKNRKPAFFVVTWLAAAAHGAGWALGLWVLWR